MVFHSFGKSAGLLHILILAGAVSTACGGSPPPEAPPPAVPTSKPAVAAMPADTSEVPEPKTLLLFTRINKPSDALKMVGAWTSLPMPASDDAAELITGKPVGRAIDLDKPIDFALASDPRGRGVKPLYAISVAVKSADEAQSVLSEHFKVSAGGSGIIKLEEKKTRGGPSEREPADDDDDGSGPERRCQLTPSAGDAKMRLICAGTDAALRELAPYLARTAPRRAYPADIHAEGRIDPLKPMVSSGKQMVPMMVRSLLGGGAGKNSSAIADVVNAVVGDGIDFALDLDRLSFDAKLEDKGASAVFTTSFKDTSSLTSRIVTSHPERADVPPAAFWHLPADSDATFFHRGVDASEINHPRDLLLEALGHKFEIDGMPTADRKVVTDALTHYLAIVTSPAVYAKGVDVAGVQKALAAVKSKKELSDGPLRKDAATKDAKPAQTDAEVKAIEQLAGWALVGVEEPATKVQAVAKEWAATFARPGVAKWLKEGSALDGLPPPTLKLQPVAAKLGLPKDTVQLELTVVHSLGDAPSSAPPAPPVAPKAGAVPSKPTAAAAPKKILARPTKLHMYFVPDGTRTWIAFGLDEALVASKVLAALGTSPEAGTLAKREGLDELRTAKVNSGGFIDVRGFAAGTAFEYVLDNPPSTFRDPFRGIAGSPQQGQTPIPFTFLSQSGTGPGRAMVVTAKVPRTAIQDIVLLAFRPSRVR
jgi:hypothetical protein